MWAAMPRLIGNEPVARMLTRAASCGRASHAYVLTGPTSVGRRTLALEVAKALNCTEAADDRPCGQCRQCRLIERNVHPDVRIVRRSPDRRNIVLRASTADPNDNIEFIQSDAQLRPAMARKKVYVIANAEELATDAADRLLKTIEEPTMYVHFLLTAADRGALLPTIASRCQEVRLHPVRPDVITQALMERQLAEPVQAERAALWSEGRPGRALALVRNPSLLDEAARDAEMIESILGSDRLGRLALSRSMAERWASNPDAIRRTLRVWLIWWRLLVMHQVQSEPAQPDGQGAAMAVRWAGRLGAAEAREALGATQRALADLDANVNARLVLDLLVLRLPRDPNASHAY